MSEEYKVDLRGMSVGQWSDIFGTSWEVSLCPTDPLGIIRVRVRPENEPLTKYEWTIEYSQFDGFWHLWICKGDGYSIGGRSYLDYLVDDARFPSRPSAEAFRDEYVDYLRAHKEHQKLSLITGNVEI